MFLNLGFAPVFPEFLCQFCGLPPPMLFSTNPSEVTNNEGQSLKKKNKTKKKNTNTKPQMKNPEKLNCHCGTAPLADSVGSTPGWGSSSTAGTHH